MSGPVVPFEYHVRGKGDGQNVEACDACAVYVFDVRCSREGGYGFLYLCRACLRRLRATLKEAEKALPKLPKRVRPE